MKQHCKRSYDFIRCNTKGLTEIIESQKSVQYIHHAEK